MLTEVDMLACAMSISETILLEFDGEMEKTRRILTCAPEGQWDWAPHEKSMSLGRLSGHVAELPSWGTAIMEKDVFELSPGEYKAYVAESAPALVETFDRHRVKARELIANASDETFHHMWTMKLGGKPVLSGPKIALIRSLMMDHLIHHRGQLSVYLRLLNVSFPGMYGPSADEAGSFAQR